MTMTGSVPPGPGDAGVPAAPDRPRPERNDFIQYLRGYAALMVVADHAILRVVRTDPGLAWAGGYAGDFGAMGVQIFFAISGYIMVAISLGDFARPGEPWRFWGKRIARIVPLYWLATLVALLMPAALGGRTFPVEQILRSLLFFAPDARPDDGGLVPVLGVGWTLNYEMFFYLLFGIGLLFRRSQGLVLVFAALAGLVAMGQIGPRVVGPAAAEHRTALYFYTHQIMLLFAAGMAIALWRHSRVFRRIPVPAPATLGALAAAGAVVALNAALGGYYPLWRTLLVYGAAALSVLLCVAARPKPRHRHLELLGDASFSIYLFHGFALTIVYAAWDTLLGSAWPLGRILVGLCLATGAGVLAYRLLEMPLVRLLKPRSRQARAG